ncbi:MAG: SMI1/KNR4 family protein [Verrucomicrobia bacterium]|nr:SMI1/KNR4 family protein [Verrucomicrobiota bacterium]
MYLDRIHRRLNQLTELGCIDIDDVAPCMEADLAALEAKLGLRLPGVVRELYLWGGKDLGNLFGGMDLLNFGQHMKDDYVSGARETLEEDGENPAILDAQALILQMDCDGQFSFVPTDQGDDPCVYTHNEQEPTFCCCPRLSDYLALMVEQDAGVEEIELVRSVEDLRALAEDSAAQVRHLLFSGEVQFGTIPEEVFAFGELRSLNLVSKGLIELSPCVGDLAFLKQLDLARNSLSSLPMALAQLDELEDLDLADNQLGTVIDLLRKLPSLRHCRLTGNPVSPEEISLLRSELPQVEII